MKKSIVTVIAAIVLLSGCASSSQQTTSQACLDALDDADHLIGVSVELTDIMVDVLDSVASLDIRGIDRSSDIDALTRQVERSTYAKNRDKCKAGA